MSKKGLALIYNAHNLLEFIWYYVKFGQDKEWDALCLPSGAKGEYMSEYCKKCGVFSKVISSEKEYISASMSEQIRTFISMFYYAATRRRSKYCKSVLNEFVDIDSYGELNLLNDIGLISGLMIALGEEKKVVILEDGIGDYEKKEKKRLLRHIFSKMDWRGFLLSVMGYSNSGHYYPLSTTKYCYKFNTLPERLQYTDYKTINRLFDFSQFDIEYYNTILNKIYSEFDTELIKEADVLLFSTKIEDFVSDASTYLKKTVDYISKQGDRLVIKKHPRDNAKYYFEGISAFEIDQTIPAEVLLPYIMQKKVYFMFPSSTLMYMANASCDVYLLYYTGMYEESLKSHHQEKLNNYCTKEKCKEYMDLMGINEYSIIEI